MIAPYGIRLLLVCLASFFLIHQVLALLAAACAPAAIRRAGLMPASNAARFLLALRLFPCSAACFVVVAFCVPAFIQLEPEASGETVGVPCLIAAFLGLMLWVVSLARGLRTVAGTRRFAKECLSASSETYFEPEQSPVWVVDASVPLVALTGVVQPKLVVSAPVIRALSRRELAAALRHEGAHRASRDNFKRLLIFLAPDLFPFVSGFRTLERSWGQFAEWAADDVAVAGRPEQSIALAAALLCVARLTNRRDALRWHASFLIGHYDLAQRIERLLLIEDANPAAAEGPSLAPPLAAFLLGLAAVAWHPALAASVHEILERLIA
jgi:Zn-dependent protease with chaperone function